MTLARLRLIGAALAMPAALALPAAARAAESVAPPTQTPLSERVAPPGFATSEDQAIAVADRTPAVRAARRAHRRLRSVGYVYAGRRWEVDYFAARRAVVEVDVTAGGRVLRTFSGPQAESYLARGHFGRLADSPWVWLAACVLFLLPFADPRRPRRILHLDLAVVLSLGVSYLFFTRGDVRTSVPLVYPVLAYLLVRLLWLGRRPQRSEQPLVPLLPTAVLVAGLLALVGGRVALNVANDKVIDVGYASVVGADRVIRHQPLYVNNDVHGDTYGPVSYLAYIPFEQVFPFSGAWDSLPSAHAATIAFDLATLLGLFLLGGRLRDGLEGRRLGLALAWAWAACPFTLLAVGVNTNDGLVAMLLVYALLALGSPAGRGALVGLASAAKFAPLALAPLFLAGRGERDRRAWALGAVALAAAVAVPVLLLLPTGGVREFYDTTIGYQLGRLTPFSPWGQDPSLDWLSVSLEAGAVALALAVAVWPRGRRNLAQVAALGAAALIAVQLPAQYWFYLYVVWFAPFLFVALLAPYRTGAATAAPLPPPEPAAREPVPA